jgi:predicted PolB exonuclease-like 3'-5' exonuclease
MDGSQVAAAYARGEIEAIRSCCETDVANTYLLYQRFQCVGGAIDSTEYERELAVFRAFLEAQPAAHWRKCMAAWR